MSCDCNHKVDPDSALGALTNHVARRFVQYCSGNACSQSDALDRLERLGKTTSTAFGVRVPNTQLAAFRKFAELRGMTLGQLARAAMQAALSVAPNMAPIDPDQAAKMIRAIAVAIGMPRDSLAGAVVAAVNVLVDAVESANPTPPEAAVETVSRAPAPGKRPMREDAHGHMIGAVENQLSYLAAGRRPAPPPQHEAVARTIKTPHGVVTLSAREIANCQEVGCKLEVYAVNKAIRDAARARKAKR